MAAWRQRWKPLQLLIIFSLLFLTNQFEVRGDVVEKLSWDMAAELHTRGTSEIQKLLKISSSSLITKQLQNHKDLDAFLVDFNKETMEDWWQSVSEISASVRQKVLVLTGSTDPSEGKMRQENSLDPQKRVPVSLKFLNNQSCVSELDGITEGEILVQNRQSGSGGSGSLPENLTLKLEPEAAADFSLHGNTTLNSGGHLPKAALVHGPEEPNQENPPVYKVTNESDPVCSSRTSQRADEPIVEFDQQQILMLEDDEVVRRAAASLYDKHPTVSSVQLVGPQQRLQQVKGQALVLSEHSSLVLVGHGARDHSGEMRVSGYSYQDVARIIQSISRTSEKIQTTTVLACDAGSDRRFREALLKKLHEAGIETELHLWTAVVQVTETGEVISQDVSAGGAQWRSEDQTKKVVLTVGRKGEIRRKESDRTGYQVLTNHTRFLGDPVNDRKLYREAWPAKPTTFIDPEVYKKVDQNKVKQLKITFRILESLTWALFNQTPAEPLRRVNAPNPADYLIGKRNGPGNLEWINDNNQKQQVLERCYVIENGGDIRNIIRHYGKDGEKEDSFLLINSWIFQVTHDGLYVHPAGKRLDEGDDRDDIKTKIIQLNQKGMENYDKIRERFYGTYKNLKIKPTEEQSNFVYNVRQIFQGGPNPNRNNLLLTTWYFTASVIAESARNFRTFPLTLMALSMNDKKFWFDKDFITMAAGGTWINKPLRGFSGAGGGNLDELAKLLGREYRTISEWLKTVETEESKEEEAFKAMAVTAAELEILENEEKTFKKNCEYFFNTAGPYQKIQAASDDLQHEDYLARWSGRASAGIWSIIGSLKECFV